MCNHDMIRHYSMRAGDKAVDVRICYGCDMIDARLVPAMPSEGEDLMGWNPMKQWGSEKSE